MCSKEQVDSSKFVTVPMLPSGVKCGHGMCHEHLLYIIDSGIKNNAIANVFNCQDESPCLGKFTITQFKTLFNRYSSKQEQYDRLLELRSQHTVIVSKREGDVLL